MEKIERLGLQYCEDDDCYSIDVVVWYEKDPDTSRGYDWSVGVRLNDTGVWLNPTGHQSKEAIQQRAAQWADNLISDHGITVFENWQEYFYE